MESLLDGGIDRRNSYPSSEGSQKLVGVGNHGDCQDHHPQSKRVKRLVGGGGGKVTGTFQGYHQPGYGSAEGDSRHQFTKYRTDLHRLSGYYNDTATPEIYTSLFVGSVRCV